MQSLVFAALKSNHETTEEGNYGQCKQSLGSMLCWQIERDKLEVLYYMVHNVMSQKLEHWATAGVESSNERRLRRRIFH